MINIEITDGYGWQEKIEEKIDGGVNQSADDGLTFNESDIGHPVSQRLNDHMLNVKLFIW